LLAEFFVHKYCKRCGAHAKPVSRAVLSLLSNYDWPGNVRELENVIERALVLGISDEILPEDLPESLLERDPAPGTKEAKYHAAVKDLKKRLIRKALEEANGNFTEAARALGVHPNYLHRLIRNLEMRDGLNGGNGGRANPKAPPGRG
jgi:DNA-binding NtrC family response regulator